MIVPTHSELITEPTPIPYWYEFNEFRLNNDYWVPFFSLTDVPQSLPLRGFIAESRNYFIDMGAFDWYSTWVEDRNWGDIPRCTDEFPSIVINVEQADCLIGFFNQMISRLSNGGFSLDYISNFSPSFDIWIPIVVFDDLSNNGFNESNMEEWVVDDELIEQTFNESFPLFNWKVDLLWLDEDEDDEFRQIYEDNTQILPNDEIVLSIDWDVISDFDQALANHLGNNFDYLSQNYDAIWPAIVFLLNNRSMYWSVYDMMVGGLGQKPSSFFTSITLNGRSQNSYFYGGDPSRPRDAITSTILHEIGHSIGLPHPNYFGWNLAPTTVTTMSYYSRSVEFDKKDQDLVLHGAVLQLWGRYLDELNYIDNQTLNMQSQILVDDLYVSLNLIPTYLYNGEINELINLFSILESSLEAIAIDNNLIRIVENFSNLGPTLNVTVDFIIGNGFDFSLTLSNYITDELSGEQIVPLEQGTILPDPMYNVNKRVFFPSMEYQDELEAYWLDQMQVDKTSNYEPDKIPENAWDQFPRNQIFTNISGYSIDGYNVEQWLVNHPATESTENSIHYRYYLFDMSDLSTTKLESELPETSITHSEETTTSSDPLSTSTTDTDQSLTWLTVFQSIGLQAITWLTVMIIFSHKKKVIK
jgi:hypothetical protein